MPHYCFAGECYNSSNQKGLSWHKLLLDQPTLLSVWITKIRRDPRYLNVNEHTKICGEHFVTEDHLNPYSVKKRLKDDAVPSILRGIKIKIGTFCYRIAGGNQNWRGWSNRHCVWGRRRPPLKQSWKISGFSFTKNTKIWGWHDHWISVAHLLSKCTTPKKRKSCLLTLLDKILMVSSWTRCSFYCQT